MSTLDTSIQFDAVCLAYDKQSIFQDLSLTFSTRGISFLLGENGAGKTQILRCIHKLSIPNSGIVSAPPRIHQAYLRQTPVLLNRSVRDNLRFVRGTPVAPAAYVDRVFDTVVDRFELQPLLTRQATTLSGGQRKRVAVARLFLQRANCYLFDEPTANIDRTNNRLIESAIDECVQNNHKVIMTTHDFLQLQRLFCEGRDELLIIKNGRLACTAKRPTSELFNQYL